MRCLIVLAFGEMRIPDSEQGVEVHRVDWAQAHGSLEMLNGFVGITDILVPQPLRSQAQAEFGSRARAFSMASKSEIKLPYRANAALSAVSTRGSSLSREAACCARFTALILSSAGRSPNVADALRIAPCGERLWKRIGRIKCDCLFRQSKSLCCGFRILRPDGGQGSHHTVIGIEAVGPFPLGPLDLAQGIVGSRAPTIASVTRS